MIADQHEHDPPPSPAELRLTVYTAAFAIGVLLLVFLP